MMAVHGIIITSYSQYSLYNQLALAALCVASQFFEVFQKAAGLNCFQYIFAICPLISVCVDRPAISPMWALALCCCHPLDGQVA